MVMLTAASDIVWPILSGTDNFTEVLRQAANITNVSSIPIPVGKRKHYSIFLEQSNTASATAN